MNGELTVLGECILLVITLLFSTTCVMIGRRLPSPASIAAYGSGMAVWVAFPLLAEANLHRVDHVIGIVGCGLLLVHVAFMVLFCGMFLTVVFMTQQWSWRHRLAVGGSGVLTAVFVLEMSQAAPLLAVGGNAAIKIHREATPFRGRWRRSGQGPRSAHLP